MSASCADVFSDFSVCHNSEIIPNNTQKTGKNREKQGKKGKKREFLSVKLSWIGLNRLEYCVKIFCEEFVKPGTIS